MKDAILLIDQTSIPAAMDAESLFVNGVHIIESDEWLKNPVKEVAESLAEALSSEVQMIKISTKQLAESMAHHADENESSGQVQAFNEAVKNGDDLDDFVEGYTNRDLLLAVKFHDLSK